MKRYLIIPGALLAFILFSAKSCVDDPGVSRLAEEEALLRVMDSVKDGFEAKYLDEESLFIYTQKAKQKLRDYSDYMNIANDSSLDSAFRNQALIMTEELFYAGFGPTESSPGLATQLDSIWLIEPLHLTGDGLYKGVLGFREEATRISGQSTFTSTSSRKNVEILATKSNKSFGTDTLEIWRIYLGIIHY